jgi:hypothetical protein
MKKEFETYSNLENSYTLNQLKKDEPSNINFLEYRKYKVTVELVDEPKDILLGRLEKLLEESKGWNKTKRIKSEIDKLKN